MMHVAMCWSVRGSRKNNKWCSWAEDFKAETIAESQWKLDVSLLSLGDYDLKVAGPLELSLTPAFHFSVSAIDRTPYRLPAAA